MYRMLTRCKLHYRVRSDACRCKMEFFCWCGGLLKGLGLSPVRLYELFPYVSEVFLGGRRGGLFLWIRGVWFFPWWGEAGGMTFAYRFFISIASAAWVFCTFKHNKELITKKKKKKERPTDRTTNHLSSTSGDWNPNTTGNHHYFPPPTSLPLSWLLSMGWC